jgi:hypothetical protein
VTILDRARAVIDREIVYSAAQVLCVGRTDAEFARRAAAIRQRPDDLNRNGLAGTPAQVVDRIGRFADTASPGSTCKHSPLIVWNELSTSS